MADHLGRHLTQEAKQQLASTIRAIREQLLSAIHNEADRRYRLSVPIDQAGLDEASRQRRERIEAWTDERARAAKPQNKADLKATKERLLAQAEKEAAATLVNRLVALRHLEALGLVRPAVVTGGWSSKGYREFREFAPALCSNGTSDATEGYATLLQLLFDELAVDLPGLFGDVGLTRLFPVPAATLRDVVERFDNSALASAWTDDTTLGWVYQYWNDPDREALDAKIDAKKKIEPYEIASKTQMFTERYMVEWLLQNSLGFTWLAMCKKHGWTADADRVLPQLEERRAEWRRKREDGEVALDALLPIDGELEEHWKYYVQQPIPQDAIEESPESVRAIKVLDPACGSGHFLVIAFDLLVALYREEARHRGTTVSSKEIAEAILEDNLHGIDIDARAAQISAAALYLKAKSLASDARPKRVNLVAPVLQLANLPPDDPAVVTLRRDLKKEVGIPEDLTNKLLSSLAGVDYLGSLLKVDAAIEEAIRSVELDFERKHGQGDLFGGFPAQQIRLTIGEAKATVLDKLEQFLAKHSKSEDIGLRLDGEQLAAGIRFVRMTKSEHYDLVVGNPPYSDTSLLTENKYVRGFYRGKWNLYAAFLERGLELARPGGISALLTMRAWMFGIESSVRGLREYLLDTFDLRTLGDVDRGAFDEVPNDLLAAVITAFRRSRPASAMSVAIQPTPLSDKSYDRERTKRKRAALLAQVGRYEFLSTAFTAIEARPLVYWWSSEFLERCRVTPKLGKAAPVKQGMATADNPRFLRKPWEISASRLGAERHGDSRGSESRPAASWVPYIKGAAGVRWFESLDDVILWESNGLQVKVYNDYAYGSYSRNIKNERFYFQPGVAFSMIGDTFHARAHRFRSVFDVVGSSVFTTDLANYVCAMNAKTSAYVLESLNPTLHFQVGDVKRLPIFPVPDAEKIYATLYEAFGAHEAGREASFEFRSPAPSPWAAAQEWAQLAVDRDTSEPLPDYHPAQTPSSPSNHMSFAVGVALGRFLPEGGLAVEAPPSALPHGIMFLSAATEEDSLAHEACEVVRAAWAENHALLGMGSDVGSLRAWLRKKFVGHLCDVYERRPVYFPLSSRAKNFVAWVSIHRWTQSTLANLLADHLAEEQRKVRGMIDDLRAARAQGGKRAREVESRLEEVQPLFDELEQFIRDVEAILRDGPPTPDVETRPRECNAMHALELDDGVLVNSASLWPLLESQWKDPKKWWKQLANEAGPKGCHFDWSRVSARYFPERVRRKCQEDPSLAVAHKCFWELHPGKAYAWELRLQDEIRREFTIDEPGSDEARAKFLAEHDREAREILAKELKRREKKRAKNDEQEEDEAGPLFADGEDGEDDSDE